MAPVSGEKEMKKGLFTRSPKKKKSEASPPPAEVVTPPQTPETESVDAISLNKSSVSVNTLDSPSLKKNKLGLSFRKKKNKGTEPYRGLFGVAMFMKHYMSLPIYSIHCLI